jgi:hypothetical protein
LMQSAKDTFCRYRNVCEEELSLQGWQEVNKKKLEANNPVCPKKRRMIRKPLCKSDVVVPKAFFQKRKYTDTNVNPCSKNAKEVKKKNSVLRTKSRGGGCGAR